MNPLARRKLNMAKNKRALRPGEAYLQRLSPGGRAAQRSALALIACWWLGRKVKDPVSLAWWRWSYQDSVRLREHLAQSYAPATVNRTLSALRGVLRECWRLGRMGREAFERAADISSIRYWRRPRGRLLSQADVAALFRAALLGDGARASRDQAALALLYVGGLRRAEAAGVDLADIDREAWNLNVTAAKGRKERLVSVAPAAPWLKSWLRTRGLDPGPFLLNVDRHGDLIWRRCSPSTIHRLVAVAGERAGLGRLHPHDLRRTCCSRLLALGDVLLVQRHLGHECTDTTKIYDARPDNAVADLVDQLPMPERATEEQP